MLGGAHSGEGGMELEPGSFSSMNRITGADNTLRAQITQRRTGKLGLYVARTHHEDLRCRACVRGEGEAHLAAVRPRGDLVT